MNQDNGNSYHFGKFVLESDEHRMWRGDEEIYLRPKAFETLLYLLKNEGRLIKKNELLDHIWPNTVVTEGTLTHCIEEIRKALNDDAYNPRFLKTVPRMGYKFIAPVEINSPEHKIMSPPKSSFEKKFINKKQLIIGSIALVVLIGIFYIPFKKSPNQIKSLAVLPFVNLNGDVEQEYFSDGMTEALITNLARHSGLRIISRTSVMCYKGKEKLLSEIGHELNVDAVVEGSVMHVADQVRITAQLVLVSPEEHLWADNFSGRIENILALQDDVAGAITKAVNQKITEDNGQNKRSVKSINPDAYHAYLKGRFFWNKRTAEGYKKAISYFNQAIELDSAYAQAYAGLADCYNLLGDYDVLPPKEVMPKAIEMATIALKIDSSLAEAYASLGFAISRYSWDWQTAESALLKAMEINPNYSEAHHWYALHLAAQGQFEDALFEIRQAQALDPLSLIINTNVGWILYFAGNFQEAGEHLQKTLEMDSNFMSAHIKLGWVLQQEGRHRKAVNEFEKALILSNNEVAVLALCAEAYALAGNKAKAKKLLLQLEHLTQQRYLSPYWKAMVYLALEDNDTAFKLLSSAIQCHCVTLIWLNVEPKFNHIRSDSRFHRLLHQLGWSNAIE